jgi:RNase P subunit RPR2
MSQVSLAKEAPAGSGRISVRTWNGTFAGAAERATHSLHLMAFPCEKCKGPVVAGWTATREDEISNESDARNLGIVCLVCGSRPRAAIDSVPVSHFRPVKWDWVAEQPSEVIERDQDPLSAELSQDADKPMVIRG